MAGSTSPRRSRLGLYLPFGALALLAAGWTGFWFVASANTSAAVDSWLMQEEALGRKWTCRDKRVSGYPFRIELHCADAQFTGRVGGALAEGKLGPLHAAAQIYDPSLIIADIAGPLNITWDHRDVKSATSWKSLRVSIRGGSAGLALASLESLEMQTETTSALGTFSTTIGHAELHARQTPPSAQKIEAFDVAVTLEDMRVPALDSVLRSNEPAKFSIMATIDRVDPSGPGAPLDKLDFWRIKGGQVEISKASLTKGAASIDASGVLRLDQQHRIAGSINADIAGLDNLLESLGIPRASGAIGALLGGLFGKPQPPAPNSANAPKGLALAIALRDGSAWLGPIRLPFRLTPLY